MGHKESNQTKQTHFIYKDTHKVWYKKIFEIDFVIEI